MLASPHSLFLILILIMGAFHFISFHFSMPMLLAGAASEGDLWPRLLRRQLLPAHPTTVCPLK
jgi:hypothetical protein